MVVPEIGTELHPETHVTSRIGRLPVTMTPGIIAARLLYARPTGETNYPVLNSDFDQDVVFDVLYEEKKNRMVPHRPGKFRPSFWFVNQLVCYNLDPRATENKPSETTGNMLVAFMEEEMVCDWARATEGLGAKYFRNDEAKPGNIDSSILRKSAAHFSGRRGALLTEPPANASVNTCGSTSSHALNRSPWEENYTTTQQTISQFKQHDLSDSTVMRSIGEVVKEAARDEDLSESWFVVADTSTDGIPFSQFTYCFSS
ncbi:hypothetical protein RHGRI_007966 [Rhododendron griersonianum]|uniref:Uncharacterized protein n=1 Tax=Rhododendron griersonianum TaxID=479676 RepID=A0AAV6L0L1_9ERIC|nr:hypothetical protein RHGRI_007966 [Rhododendron griersonianum]